MLEHVMLTQITVMTMLLEIPNERRQREFDVIVEIVCRAGKNQL